MSDNEQYTPTTAQIEVQFIRGSVTQKATITKAQSDEFGGEFLRWLAAHDAQVRESMSDYLVEQGWTNPAEVERQLVQVREEGAKAMREAAANVAENWLGVNTEVTEKMVAATIRKLALLISSTGAESEGQG